MNSIEIVLIIIGIITIIISCFLVDRSGSKSEATNKNGVSLAHSFSDDDIKQVKDKANELMSKISEDAVIRTDNSLSKLSNEKIMAVSEYSDQILEKINRNHEEVVFLYNMLNDKEKELKEVVRKIDLSKKMVKEVSPDMKKTADTQSSAINEKTKTQLKDKISVKEMKENTKTDVGMSAGSEANNNYKAILELYSQGMSVLDISKQLGLGQGEVKLVIELSKGKI